MATGVAEKEEPTIKELLEKKEYLTIKEVCRIARVSRPSVYKMTSSGRMPRPVKLGNKTIRWPAAEIREWLDKLPRATGDLG